MEIIVETVSSNVKYKLNIQNRITVIEGNSGTGKSHLVRLIDESTKSGVIIKSPREIIHLNSTILKASGNKMSKEFIYIFDEDDGLNNKNVIDFINNPEYTIIMITRDLTFPEINYSLDDIYEFKESNRYNILNKKYNYLNKTNIKKDKLDKILTEDSKSGFEFYKNLKNFKVTTSNGNSNILKNIKDNQIIVFDSLGIGPHIKYILWKTAVLNCYIVYPKSFEWLLLESGIFGRVRYNIENYKNEEEYYYKLLRQVSNLYRKPYSKDRLNKWIL